MENDIYLLPDFLVANEKADTHIHFYSTDKSSVHNKVVFNQFMIGFLLQGTKEVISKSKNVKINNQQIILLEQGSVLMSESITTNQKFESILLFFSHKFLSDFCARYQVALQNANDGMKGCPAIAKDPFLENFQNSLLLLRNSRFKDLERLKLEELLLYLYHHHNREFCSFLGQAGFSSPENTIRKVVAIEAGYKLTLEELAFLCNMSLATFKRHFKAIFKTSPKKYLTESRMLKARHLLTQKKSPSEIYAELGYESLSSFSNEFKKHFGLSPRQFKSKNEPTGEVVEPLA